jgi:hypothetical protein
MPTSTWGATGVMLLGALLAQAPLTQTATAYQTSSPTAAPTIAAPTTLPAAGSWNDVVREVSATAPHSATLGASAAKQSSSPMRCFKLEDENYCLGLGFVDTMPTAATISTEAAAPAVKSADSSTGALSASDFVAQRAAMSDQARLNAELSEMWTAWAGRDKARSLRTAGASTTPAVSKSASTMSALTARIPPAQFAMMGPYATSQERSYWCGPATLQSIDWADDKRKDTQASLARALGTSSGTSISAMVRQTNLRTNWDIAAGTYIVQSVRGWTASKFFSVHVRHLGDGTGAPVIEHVQLLKRYFPYLAFNHSGHYQVGRAYSKISGTIGIFEVFNERRFNSRGHVTNGAKNIPASALFNATLANRFKNIGL